MFAAPVAIPYQIKHECTPDYRENQTTGAVTVTQQIDLAIKNAARTITRTKLSDKVNSKTVLNKAGLRSLNEMVATSSAVTAWKSKVHMDSLGQRLFPVQIINDDARITRSFTNDQIKTPVPGYNNLAVNLMAGAWNENPELRNSSTLGSAKTAAKNWAKALSV